MDLEAQTPLTKVLVRARDAHSCEHVEVEAGGPTWASKSCCCCPSALANLRKWGGLGPIARAKRRARATLCCSLPVRLHTRASEASTYFSCVHWKVRDKRQLDTHAE